MKPFFKKIFLSVFKNFRALCDIFMAYKWAKDNTEIIVLRDEFI